MFWEEGRAEYELFDTFVTFYTYESPYILQKYVQMYMFQLVSFHRVGVRVSLSVYERSRPSAVLARVGDPIRLASRLVHIVGGGTLGLGTFPAPAGRLCRIWKVSLSQK